jgi:hypothetical protein
MGFENAYIIALYGIVFLYFMQNKVVIIGELSLFFVAAW